MSLPNPVITLHDLESFEYGPLNDLPHAHAEIIARTFRVTAAAVAWRDAECGRPFSKCFMHDHTDECSITIAENALYEALKRVVP